MNRKLKLSGFQLLCMIFMFINGTGIGESIYRDVENKKGGRREELE
ncbi:hypothetical protein ACFVRR_07340 [Gottfriedia sp. NPDC057948]